MAAACSHSTNSAAWSPLSGKWSKVVVGDHQKDKKNLKQFGQQEALINDSSGCFVFICFCTSGNLEKGAMRETEG